MNTSSILQGIMTTAILLLVATSNLHAGLINDIIKAAPAPISGPLKVASEIAEGKAPTPESAIPIFVPDAPVLSLVAGSAASPQPQQAPTASGAPSNVPNAGVPAQTRPSDEESKASIRESEGGVLPVVLALKVPLTALLFAVTFLVFVFALRNLSYLRPSVRQ